MGKGERTEIGTDQTEMDLDWHVTHADRRYRRFKTIIVVSEQVSF